MNSLDGLVAEHLAEVDLMSLRLHPNLLVLATSGLIGLTTVAVSSFSIMLSQMANDATAKKYRLKFTLKTLLLVMTVFGVWLGSKVQRANKQRLAVEQIEQLGGNVVYSYELIDAYSWKRSNKPMPGPKWLRNLIGDDYFVRVAYVKQPRGHGEASYLSSLPDIERIDLQSTPITDDDLVHLRDMRNLKSLHCSDSQIKGPGLKHLSNCKDLRSLDLRHTQEEEVELTHLEALQKLKTSYSYNFHVHGENEIADEAVEYLLRIEKLKQLETYRLAVDDTGGGEVARYIARLNLGVTLSHKQTMDEVVKRLTVALSSGQIDKSSVMTGLYSQEGEFSDAGLEQIAKFAKLERLHLGFAAITDEGLVHLRALKNLTELDLYGTSISDDSVPVLASLGQLTKLTVFGTRVTKEGGKRLQDALPACAVRY